MPEAPPIAPPAAPKFLKDIVPQDLHDRGYLKDLLEKELTPETYSAVFKKLDGAETLIGKKPTGIPAADAKPEEIEAFYSKLGLEKPEGYDIKLLGEKPDESFAKEVQAAAHKGRLTQTQLNGFLAELGPKVAARQKAVAEAQAARDKEFEVFVSEAMGPEFDKKVDRVKAAVAELAPEKARKFIDNIDNKSLALLVGLVDGILTKYAGEDDFKGNGGNGRGRAADDKESLVKELHTLYASEGWKNFQSPDHDKTKKRVDEILASSVFK